MKVWVVMESWGWRGLGTHKKWEREVYLWNETENIEVSLGERSCFLGPVPSGTNVILQTADPRLAEPIRQEV